MIWFVSEHGQYNTSYNLDAMLAKVNINIKTNVVVLQRSPFPYFHYDTS